MTSGEPWCAVSTPPRAGPRWIERPARTAPHRTTVVHAATRPGSPVRTIRGDPIAKGPSTMLPDLTAIALLTAADTAVLAAVYLWSADRNVSRD